jgi:hypothetical protein
MRTRGGAINSHTCHCLYCLLVKLSSMGKLKKGERTRTDGGRTPPATLSVRYWDLWTIEALAEGFLNTIRREKKTVLTKVDRAGFPSFNRTDNCILSH